MSFSNHLPNQTDIEALYDQYHTPVHIQEHMHAVAALAMQMGENINANGGDVNIPLLRAAALVHDLIRIPDQWQYLPDTISTPQTHAEVNYLLLRDTYPTVAATVRPHSLMTILNEDPFTTLEEKIVFYADKRVNHSTVVSLQQRLALGQERWGVTDETDRSEELLAHLQKLEDGLFLSITLSPEELHA